MGFSLRVTWSLQGWVNYLTRRVGEFLDTGEGEFLDAFKPSGG